jgi:hypothetical protein
MSKVEQWGGTSTMSGGPTKIEQWNNELVLVFVQRKAGELYWRV